MRLEEVNPTKIKLKKDTEMSTGYLGRGKPSKMITVPAGTEVSYKKEVTGSGTYHTVWLVKDGQRYEASLKNEK